MTPARAQLVLGGSWHDFPAFAAAARALAARAGVAWNGSAELSALERIDALGCELLVLYTCLDEHSPVQHSQAGLVCLTRWVERGGALLALHASAVAAQQHPELAALLGGVFVGHPPKRRFAVRPVSDGHPITAGVPEFSLEDEPYELACDGSARVHLTRAEAGGALAWSRAAGSGRVTYLALGHDASAWTAPGFAAVFVNALRWLAGARSG